MDYKKILHVFFAGLVCALFAYQLTANTDWHHTYRQEWEVCIDYLKEGTLYGGQPHCATGIMLFYTGYLFKTAFGSIYQEALKAFIIILFSLYLYFVWKILKKEGNGNDIWLFTLLSLLLMYSQISGDNFEKGLAMVFVFFGYYLLYHSTVRFSWAYASLLFSAAFLSSVQSLIVIGILVAWYPIQFGLVSFSLGGGNRVSIKKQGVVIVLGIVTIFLMIFLFLQHLYPNILKYILLAHSTDPLYTSGDALAHLLPSLSIDKDLFAVYVVLLISAFVFYRSKEVSPLAGGIGLAIIMFMQHKGSGGITIGRYMAPAFPFIILTLYQYKKMMRKGNYFELFSPIVLFLLFIFPALALAPFLPNIYNLADMSLNDFKKEVGYGVHFIPPQEGRIMVDDPAILALYDYPYAPNQVAVASGSISHAEIDAWSGPRLEKLGLTQLAEWTPLQQISEEKITAEQQLLLSTQQEIETGKYSMILYGPSGSSSVLGQAFNGVNESVRNSYCTIIFPNIEHTSTTSNHVSYANLKNTAHCEETVKKMAGYYYRAFDDICKKSRYVANNVVDFTFKRFYQIDLGKTCPKGGKFIEDFNNDPLFWEHYLIILGALVLVSGVGILRLQTGAWEGNMLLRKLHYISLAALVTLMVVIWRMGMQNIGVFGGF